MKLILMAGTALALAAGAAAADITVTDAYARSASPAARTGAAFFVIENTGDADDTLVGAASDAADMVELHTHIEGEGGLMQMRPVEGGLTVPAGSRHTLRRGGDHVMFMGLTAGWEQGDSIPVTLTFERAGEVALEIPVDNARQPDEAAHGGAHEAGHGTGHDSAHGGDHDAGHGG
ncbi:hypothetical protein ROJ8625_02395 [Roseivivax jejudonensis]|uniref:Copper chaperone PCu(A)C n=1 Tax=Roseivivax jejudonensis TaxID=1529041 RepID=A0A1X6ZDV2_9RHOB|nr:copper chaperone PCu(A)C [Roseivivax jejudonensis]SLN48874.1 hypothetical protein ROJ8625_02395 [Roseivivax jejudonensis]